MDGTFGAGGYSRAILKSAPCKVFALDVDPFVEVFALELAREFPGAFKLLKGNFSEMETLLSAQGIGQVDGIVLDIGVSSMQLDVAERGFSFQSSAPLDMRMSAHGMTAADLVNTLDEKDLAKIIFDLGGEKNARRIAKAIVAARKEKRIDTTNELTAIIHRISKTNKKIDPATQTFQALRIHLNHELDHLEKALEAAEKLLKPGGKLVVVSFHELEDRIVKTFLKERSGKKEGVSRHTPIPHTPSHPHSPSFFCATMKAIQPSEEEVASNPRARSARLRAATRTDAPVWRAA